MFDFVMRGGTILLLLCWGSFWLIMRRRAEREKAKRVHPSVFSWVRRGFSFLFALFILIQLVGVSFLPFSLPWLQVAGLVLFLGGFCLAIAGRIRLGGNWTASEEYQIKHHHELITTGVYRYIRHPLYLSFILGIVGAELVAQSYLVVPFFPFSSLLAYQYAKREEVLLLQYFDSQYVQYMKKTNKFIPYIF